MAYYVWNISFSFANDPENVCHFADKGKKMNLERQRFVCGSIQ